MEATFSMWTSKLFDQIWKREKKSISYGYLGGPVQNSLASECQRFLALPKNHQPEHVGLFTVQPKIKTCEINV